MVIGHIIKPDDRCQLRVFINLYFDKKGLLERGCPRAIFPSTAPVLGKVLRAFECKSPPSQGEVGYTFFILLFGLD